MKSASRTSWLGMLSAAAVSGILLFISDYPLHLWPLQALALIPWFFGLVRFCRSWAAGLAAGACLGLFYTGPLNFVLQFPLLMGLGLTLYITFLLALLSMGVFLVTRWSPVWAALGTGAVAVLVEWVDFSLLPVFGTAQAFVRVWSAGPWTMQFVALVGPLGLVFVVVVAQALLVNLLLRRRGRKAAAVTLVLLLAAVAAYNAVAWFETPSKKVRVAAIGWTTRNPRLPTDQVFEKHYLPLLRQASESGAGLVVSPETGFFISAGEKQRFMSRVFDAARQHGVMLVCGYFNRGNDDNRIMFISKEGKLLAEYRKTHLIPGIEDYSAGDGNLAVVPFAGVKLGGMICQDDNFTDIARAYGRERVSLVAVPTNDWAQVKNHHFENSLFRGMENRYAIVRSATNGISAVVSARGEVLAKKDHFEKGPGVVVVDVPLYKPGGIYSLAGDWLLVAGFFLLIIGLLINRFRSPEVP